jgi:hypothetical protein
VVNQSESMTSFSKVDLFVVVDVLAKCTLEANVKVSRNRKQLDHVFPSQPIRDSLTY